ncbi:hypothetical protein BFS35_011210 [Macrococcoides goetzii]|uniref:Stress protein n=1 Tax=Macrococcoides goetzii TaxID=1891097 RepID=A0A2G5NUN1_9STAP|nr:hypothetical protein [Macrococcus goetzii]RAI79707.1 hypothetical protein BFS35_011210 [Macrococcus goetzii]
MKIKLLSATILSTTLLLTACGGNEGKNDAQTEQKQKEVTIDTLIKSFDDKGLSVKDVKKMSHEDFGPAPMKSKEAKQFVVEKDMNARLFYYDNENDLKEMKKYYDQLGKESAMLFSHTYAKGKFLIQANGSIDEKVFKKYTDVMDKEIK